MKRSQAPFQSGYLDASWDWAEPPMRASMTRLRRKQPAGRPSIAYHRLYLMPTCAGYAVPGGRGRRTGPAFGAKPQMHRRPQVRKGRVSSIVDLDWLAENFANLG